MMADRQALADRRATGCQYDAGVCVCPSAPYEYEGCRYAQRRPVATTTEREATMPEHTTTGQLATALRALADALDATPTDLAAPVTVTVGLQAVEYGARLADRVATVDALAALVALDRPSYAVNYSSGQGSRYGLDVAVYAPAKPDEESQWWRDR